MQTDLAEFGSKRILSGRRICAKGHADTKRTV
jgi:hypothetical protein